MVENPVRSPNVGSYSAQPPETKHFEGDLGTHSVSILQDVMQIEETLKANTVGKKVIEGSEKPKAELSSSHSIAPAQKTMNTIQKVINAVCLFFSFIQEKLDRSFLSNFKSRIQKIDILSGLNFGEKGEEMQKNYSLCIDAKQEITDKDRNSRDGTVQGGLAKDFDRKPPSHIYFKTPTQPIPKEILLTSIDQTKLAPLLTDKSDCLEVVQYFQDHVLNDSVIKCYAKIKEQDPSKLSDGEKEKLKQELEEKRVSLSIVSEKLQKTLEDMKPIIGDSLGYQDQINVAKAKWRQVGSNEVFWESQETGSTTKAKEVLKKFGFAIGDDFKLSEEVAYEILSILPDTVRQEEKSAILQGIRSTTTLIPQKDLSRFGNIKLSEIDPHTVNVIIDDSGGIFIRHAFTMDLLSTEIVDDITEEQSNGSWSEIKGSRQFACEVLLDIKKGRCFHSIEERGVSDTTFIDQAKKILHNIIKI